MHAESLLWYWLEKIDHKLHVGKDQEIIGIKGLNW